MSSMYDFGVFLGGRWHDTPDQEPVLDKYSGEVIGRVGNPSPDQVDTAISLATEAVWGRSWAPEDRVRVLSTVSALVAERSEVLAQLHTAETGFTLVESRAEVDRTIGTLVLCAEEAKRFCGEMVPISWYPGAEGRTGYTEHRPIGPVCAITPFNSPLNTVAHKLGPAFGAGNSVVLKPSVQAPLSAAMLAGIFVEAGLPDGFLSVVFGGADVGSQLLRDPRFGFYAFTGSSAVGRIIANAIGIRRSQLELGSIASTIVCADADPDDVARQVSVTGFRRAGQVCTSVQRLVVHESLLDVVADHLAKRVSGIVVGDPRDPGTTMGPMIDAQAAARASSWVAEAQAQGASVLTGGAADGALMQPAVLLDVTPTMKVVTHEVFGPVVSVVPFSDIDSAVDIVNSSPYGLAAGIFTDNYRTVRSVVRRVRVGTLQVNATSSNRYDSMPFGGVKDSGFGKEGPRYAMRAMSDEMFVVWN